MGKEFKELLEIENKSTRICLQLLKLNLKSPITSAETIKQLELEQIELDKKADELRKVLGFPPMPTWEELEEMGEV